MSALWTTTPTTIRLDDLDVICTVLDCTPAELLIREPEQVEARRTQTRAARTAGDPTPGGLPSSTVTPPLGRNRSLPPA
jgi:putative transcriptional regulator